MPQLEILPRLSEHMGIIDAIYKRRAVRDFLPKRVDDATIHSLLYAAVQAPTAMHEEPWAFAVVQDKALLDRLSHDAKKLLQEEAKASASPHAARSAKMVSDPAFNIFYNAATLVVIYGKAMGPFVVADCWLAAENMMLAATAAGLGSCVIGFAVQALNTTGWKKELGIEENMTAYAPILLGYPASLPEAGGRKPPDVLCWKKAIQA